VNRPVIARWLGELACSVEGVDDPDTGGLQPHRVVSRFLAEHGIVRAVLSEEPHEQLVGYTIARVLERTTLEPLASHLEESVTGHGREPGSQ
jgi:hypothetical protein